MRSLAARFFDAIAHRYDRVYALDAVSNRARMSRILRELMPRSRVLDLGVGTGRELSALLDAGHEPTGLDLSAEMLALCMRRSRQIPLVHADFYAPLPFETHTFDAALALHGTLAHSPSDEALVDLAGELARVIKPAGKIFVEVPTRAWIDYAERSGVPIERTSDTSFFHTDETTGARIEARILEIDEWRAHFGRHFDLSHEPISEYEHLLIGRRL